MNEFSHMKNIGGATVDDAVLNEAWSVLSEEHMPEIDYGRMHRYRRQRLIGEMKKADVSLLVMINPVSLHYSMEYTAYQLFQAHIPETCVFYSVDGPIVMYGVTGKTPEGVAVSRPMRPLAFFDAGNQQEEASRLLAEDIVRYLNEVGCANRRVAVEHCNPSLVRALDARGVEVVDGNPISEAARVIKSEDEIACIKWAIAVAQHGIAKMQEVLRPGVSELQLWGLLNYTNLANQGGWHDGRMLASGPRTNPWLQEASKRRIESGDLVAFDTDMVGPGGYFADISRTLHCGPDQPTQRQKEIYRLAHAEVESNLKLVRAGVSLLEIQDRAFDVPENCQEQAYPCIMHAVGMCDEYPRVNYRFRGKNFYDCTLESGMVMCIESYMGAEGETNGVKLEQQVLVTDQGYELLSTYPFEECLLD